MTKESPSEILISQKEIEKRVKELAEEISRDYKGKPLLLVGILKGAIIFMADLMRAMELPVQVDFVAVSSYGSSTKTSGVVRILKDLDADIRGVHVLLVEDIIDSGLTLNYLRRNLKSREPASLEVCALLNKEGRQRVSIEVKYLGFTVPNRFVVGYGLDFAEDYRYLPYICALKDTDSFSV